MRLSLYNYNLLSLLSKQSLPSLSNAYMFHINLSFFDKAVGSKDGVVSIDAAHVITSEPFKLSYAGCAIMLRMPLPNFHPIIFTLFRFQAFLNRSAAYSTSTKPSFTSSYAFAPQNPPRLRPPLPVCFVPTVAWAAFVGRTQWDLGGHSLPLREDVKLMLE